MKWFYPLPGLQAARGRYPIGTNTNRDERPNYRQQNALEASAIVHVASSAYFARSVSADRAKYGPPESPCMARDYLSSGPFMPVLIIEPIGPMSCVNSSGMTNFVAGPAPNALRASRYCSAIVF